MQPNPEQQQPEPHDNQETTAIPDPVPGQLIAPEAPGECGSEPEPGAPQAASKQTKGGPAPPKPGEAGLTPPSTGPRKLSGKVAALPLEKRIALATRLNNGETYEAALQAEGIEGISKQNLSNWWNSVSRKIQEDQEQHERDLAQKARSTTEREVLSSLIAAVTASLHQVTAILTRPEGQVDDRLKLQVAWVLPSIASTMASIGKRLDTIADKEQLKAGVGSAVDDMLDYLWNRPASEHASAQDGSSAASPLS